MFPFKIIHNLTCSDITNTATATESTIVTRSYTNNVVVLFARRQIRQHSFGLNVWNNLPN